MAQDISKSFYDKINTGATPNRYITITTDAGIRLFADRALGDTFEAARIFYDGTYLYDGSVTYGEGFTTISKEPLLVNIGNIKRSTQTIGLARSKAGNTKRQSSLIATLNDADNKLGKRFTTEPILGKQLSYYLGFSDISSVDHLLLYTGTINSIIKKSTELVIKSVEI